MQTHPARSALLRLGQRYPDLLDAQEVDCVPDPAERRLRALTPSMLDIEVQGRKARVWLLSGESVTAV